MSKESLTIVIEYEDSMPEIAKGMSLSELSQEFDGYEEIVAVAFYNALEEGK